jgi:hypothetical protein
MRNLLILGGIGVLITVAWTAIADDGASGSGRGHANPARGGFEHPMRHGGSHSSLIWQFGMGLLTREETYPREEAPAPVPTIPSGGLVVVGTEHMIAGHLLAELSILQHIHVQAEARHAHVEIPQAAAPSSAEPDQGEATASPNPTANPLQARPPGAAGPGQRVSGQSGPGLPGPGRPASSR